MFFDNYQENYMLLSDRESEVIDYLVKEDSLEGLTLKKITQDLHISSSTVIRASKKMGYETYNDLKYNLQFSKQSRNSQVDQSNLTWINFKTQLGFELQQNFEIFQQEDFDTFSNYILKARRVFCVGIGSSSMVASDFNRKLKLVNIWSNDYYEQHSIKRISDISTKEDLIIVFSISGNDNDIKDVVMAAKQNQTKILSITSFNSPLVQLSDHTICIFNSPISRKKLRHRLSLNLVDVLLFENLLLHLDNRI